MQQTKSFLSRALRTAIPTPDVIHRVERLRVEAFDYFREQLMSGKLEDSEKINALRFMSLITRQMCVERKPEVLDSALHLMEDDSLSVRSAACHVAILALTSIESLTGRSDRKRVLASLRRAQASGLDENYKEFVSEFLGRRESKKSPNRR